VGENPPPLVSGAPVWAICILVVSASGAHQSLVRPCLLLVFIAVSGLVIREFAGLVHPPVLNSKLIRGRDCCIFS
jgi:hypothetical protein